MWTKEHFWSKRDKNLRRSWNARVGIKHDQAGAFRKRQRVAGTSTVSITPRTAAIRNRGLQSFDPIVAIDAGNDLTSYIRDVTEELTRSIPARLWRVTERVARDVYFLANRSECDRIIDNRQWCGNLTPTEHGAQQRRAWRYAAQPNDAVAGVTCPHASDNV